MATAIDNTIYSSWGQQLNDLIRMLLRSSFADPPTDTPPIGWDDSQTGRRRLNFAVIVAVRI